MAYLTNGYAAGSTDAGTWLTVWGSAHDCSLVYGTLAEAQRRADDLRSRSAESYRDSIVVRRVQRVAHGGVTMTGEAYRILADTPGVVGPTCSYSTGSDTDCRPLCTTTAPLTS